jgi:hypothetical protein
MEDILVWLFWAAIIVGSMASSASKAKKRREEEARRAVARREADNRDASVAKSSPKIDPGRKSLTELLEDLARQADEQPSPTVVSRPLSGSVPDSRPVYEPVSRPAYEPVSRSASGHATQSRQMSPALSSRSLSRYGGELGAEGFVDEVAAYERLAAERTHRTTLVPALVGTADDSMVAPIGSEGSGGYAGGDTPAPLRELLGGDFDLRRAVIEAEILTPKYIQ